MTIRIDSDIPVPAGRGGRGRPPKYPFAKMNVGDSFQVGFSHRDAANVRNCLHHFKGKPGNENKVFAVLHVGDNVWRCWRLEDKVPEPAPTQRRR